MTQNIEPEFIDIQGARTHNLKNIDVRIPRNSLTVITGLSGSGKSSLAFDTIFAEGQRRYIETFSAYARNFLGNLERPDVDKITGLSPVISIEQKTTNRSPRSTVGTATEIYDFFRLLYARAGEAFSYETGERMIKYTEEQIIDLLIKNFNEQKVHILSPVVRNRKGHYKELFEQFRKKGFLNIRVDGEMREIVPAMKLDRYKNHTIEIIIDKLTVYQKDEKRLKSSVRIAMRQGDGLMTVMNADGELRHFSSRLMCPVSGTAYSEPAPHSFSFNSPRGACPRCRGLGHVNQTDINKIIPDPKLNIREGGIAPLGRYKNTLIFWQIEAILEKYGVTSKTPLSDVPEEAINDIMNGTEERLQIKNESLGASNYYLSFEGVAKYIAMQQEQDTSAAARKWAEQFIRTATCPECEGKRLNKEALNYFIAGKSIADISELDITALNTWVSELDQHLNSRQRAIASEILKEIQTRLGFLINVGLSYLSLSRSSTTLSGGESQRIRLATQIGSQLVNVLYILDEPSIGLHQRDNSRLTASLRSLRDLGNTVIVVEHDRDMMLAADCIIDLGPRAGLAGGEVLFSGTPEELLKADTLTSHYLTGVKRISPPSTPRPGNRKTITLRGARGNNLKNVTLTIPLGKLICITGVSGSGKSSLINGTLQPIISHKLYRSHQEPLPYDTIEGIENIDKIVTVDQSPIGRTPRSNPATYTGIMTDIRDLFAELPESKIRGYKPGRFSFNINGGRCDACLGTGQRTIEMNFLPDVTVPCDNCHGKRYNRETLEIRYRGKSISDILEMTVDSAVEFFTDIPSIYIKIKTIQDTGLGYLRLGQSSTTLSGGESQRIKLSSELSRRDTGNTLYILDEPTTGLHFDDIHLLLTILHRLADQGNTIIIIEHNTDVILSSDHVIDLGPEGGRSGGEILFSGTPAQLISSGRGYTAQYLSQP
ncbi:MAG: excinuclease ABC subunit UvrA [Dysgonamonadaceae bacterium]|jgi:excinuclease ABC subunit A|nr:excinuclease ABC subunit UvrA [Dysgonamonadaceae bacterium]